MKLTVSIGLRFLRHLSRPQQLVSVLSCEGHRLQMLDAPLDLLVRLNEGAIRLSSESFGSANPVNVDLVSPHLRRLRVFRNVTGVVVAVGEDCDGWLGWASPRSRLVWCGGPCCLKFAWMARTFLDALLKQLQKVLQTVSTSCSMKSRWMRCRSRVTCWFPQRRAYSLQSPSAHVCLRHDAGGGT